MKRTFQPSLVSKKRKQGFLTRLSKKSGRLTILRRRMKGRKTIAG